MDEKGFKELLLENNKLLLQEMDTRMDNKIKDNNRYLIEEMDKMMDKKIFESERRQNQKLAKLEHEYGDKISAIFDKIVSMEEILLNTRAESIKNENKIEEHADMLFSQNFRISRLEEQVYSK